MLRSSSCCVGMVICMSLPVKKRNYDVKQAVVRLKIGGYNQFYYDSRVAILYMWAG